MTRRRSVLVLALAAAAMLATTACGLGDKQSYAERIHGSQQKAVKAKTASGTLTFEITPDPDNPKLAPEGAEGGAGAGAAGAGGGGAAAALAGAGGGGVEALLGGGSKKAQFAIDLDFAHRAAQLKPAAAEAEVSTIFTGERIFVRRLNLRPTEKRIWAKLDFTKLPDDEPRPTRSDLEGDALAIAAANSINPTFFVDLALGALTGSIKPMGQEDVAGVKTSKYESNVSIDRVFTELDPGDTALEARRLMLRLLLNRSTDVGKGEYWVDDEGLLRRARFKFSQRVDRDENNDVVVTMDLTSYGAPVAIASPSADQTVQVERFGRMVRAAVPRS
jgi:hypothetical protein